jgi:hypothetical protein
VTLICIQLIPSRYFEKICGDREETGSYWINSDGESVECSPPDHENPLVKEVAHDRPSSGFGMNGPQNWSARSNSQSRSTPPHHQNSLERPNRRAIVGQNSSSQGIPIPRSRNGSNCSSPQFSSSPKSPTPGAFSSTKQRPGTFIFMILFEKFHSLQVSNISALSRSFKGGKL